MPLVTRGAIKPTIFSQVEKHTGRALYGFLNTGVAAASVYIADKNKSNSAFLVAIGPSAVKCVLIEGDVHICTSGPAEAITWNKVELQPCGVEGVEIVA